MEDNNKQAKFAYESMCACLDEMGLKYEKDESEMVAMLSAIGDDLPMSFIFKVIPELSLIALISKMPFDVPENARGALAVAVSIANCMIKDGDFGFDITSGDVSFRMTTWFNASILGKEVFEYMTKVAFMIVDRFNDKFLRVASEQMGLQQIIELITEGK